MGAASHGRGSNSDANDDDDDSNESSNAFGPNFGSSFNSNNDGEGEGSSANGDGQPMNLNQAASGYPAQGDYNNDAGVSFGFGGSSGYGPSMGEGSEFGPSDGFSGESRRAKSASSPMGARNYGSDDDGALALQYGPNSAVNSGERDVDGDDGRAGYSPDGQGDNDNDDE